QVAEFDGDIKKGSLAAPLFSCGFRILSTMERLSALLGRLPAPLLRASRPAGGTALFVAGRPRSLRPLLLLRLLRRRLVLGGDRAFGPSLLPFLAPGRLLSGLRCRRRLRSGRRLPPGEL